MRRLIAAGLVIALLACGSDEPQTRAEGSPETTGTSQTIDTTPATQPTGTTTTTATTPTTHSTERVEGAPLVLASSQGVVLMADGREVASVSTTPAAAAYGVDRNLVVFQDAEQGDVYPPRPRGPARVWSPGGVRDLPTGSETTRTELLHAGVIDGVPVALVAERVGGGQPADTFEELVRVDLRDGSRTTIVRRPAWESGHVAARLLPGGDVIGLFSSEATLLLARWSAGQARWTVEAGVDTHLDLASVDGDVVTVEPSFDDARGFAPVLTLTAHDPMTGEPRSTETINVDDPEGQISTGLSCRDRLAPTELACGRSGGVPVAVSVSDGAFRLLGGDVGAIPMVIPSSQPS